MEMGQPLGFWLRVNGCLNGAIWVNTEFPANGVMYLTRGWKSFTRARYLVEGHLLHFKLVESDTLSVKLFGPSGAPLEC